MASIELEEGEIEFLSVLWLSTDHKVSKGGELEVMQYRSYEEFLVTRQ